MRGIFFQRTKAILENFSWLYITLLKIKYRKHYFISRIVSKSTDIVIEGFPRSANSFACRAFEKSQNGKSIIIATHTHSHAQIIESIKLGKPTIVLIRKPEECIVSLKALNLQTHSGDETIFKKYPINEYIRWYIRFYKSLLPYKGQFILAKFEDVTSNYGKIIERLNQKYGLNYNIFIHNKENQQKIFNAARFHLSPSEERNSYKLKIIEEYNSKENMNLVGEANSVYNKFIL
jgi:hypothetical protein